MKLQRFQADLYYVSDSNGIVVADALPVDASNVDVAAEIARSWVRDLMLERPVRATAVRIRLGRAVVLDQALNEFLAQPTG